MRTGGRLAGFVRFAAVLALALAVFAALLFLFGKNPLKAYADIFSGTLGSAYGFSEMMVRMIPLVLTAMAVALPSRIWLINVGGKDSSTSVPFSPPGGRSRFQTCLRDFCCLWCSSWGSWAEGSGHPCPGSCVPGAGSVRPFPPS